MAGENRIQRLKSVPSICVDAMGARADAASDPDILRLENLDTDLRPPQAAAVAAHLRTTSGQTYHSEEECIITAGARGDAAQNTRRLLVHAA